MINKNGKTYLHNRDNYFKLDTSFGVRVKVDCNTFDIPIENLFGMSQRNNPKRRFLFVSKVLGKHLPINPKISLLVGFLLACEYMKVIHKQPIKIAKNVARAIATGKNVDQMYEYIMNNKLEIPEATLFLGFAETATALGYSVFNSFRGKNEYIHTTREDIIDIDYTISFEEEHSHAIDHRLYAQDSQILDSAAPIVLIDDEITTGNTNINIIKKLNKKYPRQKYVLISILDWRSQNDITKLEQVKSELGIDITSVALIKGSFEVASNSENPINLNKNPMVEIKNEKLINNVKNLKRYKIHINSWLDTYNYSSKYANGEICAYPYLAETGRFTIRCADQGVNANINVIHKMKKIGKILEKERDFGPSLCLGTGEFMYLPMLIAANMGDKVYYHSTTRSPVLPDDSIENYEIKSAFVFSGIEDKKICNYLYNLDLNSYRDVFVFFEREVAEIIYDELTHIFDKIGLLRFNIVVFSENIDGGSYIDVKPF